MNAGLKGGYYNASILSVVGGDFNIARNALDSATPQMKARIEVRRSLGAGARFMGMIPKDVSPVHDSCVIGL